MYIDTKMYKNGLATNDGIFGVEFDSQVCRQENHSQEVSNL